MVDEVGVAADDGSIIGIGDWRTFCEEDEEAVSAMMFVSSY